MATFIKSPVLEETVNIANSGTTPADVLSVLIVSRRGNDFSGSEITTGICDFPLYYVNQVPSQYLGSGTDVLNYLQSNGVTVANGVSASINMTKPDLVQVQGDNTVLSWTAEPIGYSDLLAGNISGTVTQLNTTPGATATGTILFVSQGTYAITMQTSTITGTFLAAADSGSAILNVSYTNNSIAYPDGLNTERFALDLFYAVEALNAPDTLNVTFATPNVYFVIVSDRDNAFSPDDTPLTLGTPDEVVANGDGTYSLFWDALPANWKYVPRNGLSSSYLSQSSGAVKGTILTTLGPQYSPNLVGAGIQVKPTVGTFTAAATSMVLDGEVNVLSLLGNNYYRFVQMTYEVVDNEDFNTNYFQFRDYINTVNADQASSNGQYGTLGVFAVSSVAYNDYASTAFPNSQYFIYPNYYYPNAIGDVYIKAGQVAAAYAGLMSANTSPYALLNGIVINGLPVSSVTSTYIDTTVPTGQAEQLLQYGQSPIAVNSSGQAYAYMPATTLVSRNGVVEQEFWDVHTWQIVFVAKYRVGVTLKGAQFQNRQIDDEFLNEQEQAVFTVLMQMQKENMIFNVPTLQSTISATEDSVNPHNTDVSWEMQIDPSYTGSIITINLLSALTAVTTTSA